MGKFDPDMEPVWGAPDKMQCKRCGHYGRCSLNIYVVGFDDQRYHACMASVCIDCNDGQGRLESLYTGTHSHPDYSCQNAKLPPGITLTQLHQALLTKPLRRVWSAQELTKFKRGLYD